MITIEDILQASRDGFTFVFGVRGISVYETRSQYLTAISPCVYSGNNIEHAMLAIAATKEAT